VRKHVYESFAEWAGRYDQALAVLEVGRLLGEEISSPWSVRYPNQRAWLSAELGDWETAYVFDLAGSKSGPGCPAFKRSKSAPDQPA
jgi:hypothetical protein